MNLEDYNMNFSEAAHFDKAICLTGYGKFHYKTIAVCAVSIITVGFQNGMSAYVFPVAQCDLNLTPSELGLLNIMFLSGGIVSCFVWGILADINGRKKILITAHLLNTCVTLLCAFISFKSSLIICRFFNGFLIGAPGAIIFSYLAEFQPPKYKSASVCYCGLFFTSSWLILPVFAHLVLPLNINYKLGNYIIINSWRLYLVLMVIPEAIAGLLFIHMPESPKFYMANGNCKEALAVLKGMYSMNTGKNRNTFPVKYLNENSQNNHNFSDVYQKKRLHILLMTLMQGKILFKSPLSAPVLLTCTVMFTNMFGVYGLGLWLPELLVRFKQYNDLYPNETITVKKLSTLNEVKNLTCKPSFDPVVIQSTIAMAVSSVLYNLISGFFTIKFQVKSISAASMVLGAISAGSIYWLESTLQNVAVACVFQASMVTANMTIGSIAVDLFPTKVSAVALCLIICAGRVGAACSNIIFGYLIEEHCEIAIFTVAAVVLLGAALCIIIPKKTNLELINTSSIKEKTMDVAVIS